MIASSSTPDTSGASVSLSSGRDATGADGADIARQQPVERPLFSNARSLSLLPSISNGSHGHAGNHGVLRCGRYAFSLAQPLVMGILNVTPDSFSDGGRYQLRDAALRRAEAMIREGVHVIDIGGESTRPGAPEVSLSEELDRVLPVVEALRDCGVALSIDTYKPDLMVAALAAGADMINDIRAFSEEGALEAVARSTCAVCVMHMQGAPATMQEAPAYDNVVDEIRHFLERRVIALESSGVSRERMVVDPGFGFGKTVAHNYRLLRDLPMTSPGGLPILVGMSRKSMLAAVMPLVQQLGQAGQSGQSGGNEEPVAAQRVVASVAAALCAAERGAAIIRVHDVGPTVEALSVWRAIGDEQPGRFDARDAFVEAPDLSSGMNVPVGIEAGNGAHRASSGLAGNPQDHVAGAALVDDGQVGH